MLNQAVFKTEIPVSVAAMGSTKVAFETKLGVFNFAKEIGVDGIEIKIG